MSFMRSRYCGTYHRIGSFKNAVFIFKEKWRSTVKNTMIICLKKGFGADKPDLFYKPANKFQNSLPNVTSENKTQKSAPKRGFFYTAY